jgi:hypothetical protein
MQWIEKMDKDAVEYIAKRKSWGQEINMSFNDGSKEVVLVYVLEGICSYTKKNKNPWSFFKR